ncbi:MAG: C40 family peptidase [Candidatus Competibacter denitrificans]
MPILSRLQRTFGLAIGLAGSLWLTGCATSSSHLSSDQSGARQRVLAIAERLIGTPYRLGGESPGGMDCSGLVQYTYQQAGIRLPRTTGEQLRAGQARRQVLPGDLLFFHGGNGTVSHVGIYAGRGEMIHASSGAGRVLKTRLNQRYWQRHLLGGATFLERPSAPMAGSRFNSDGFSG